MRAGNGTFRAFRPAKFRPSSVKKRGDFVLFEKHRYLCSPIYANLICD